MRQEMSSSQCEYEKHTSQCEFEKYEKTSQCEYDEEEEETECISSPTDEHTQSVAGGEVLASHWLKQRFLIISRIIDILDHSSIWTKLPYNFEKISNF